MSTVFFSYRRKDTESITGRIIDRLKKSLPYVNVFHDIESIPVGENFADFTRQKLDESDIFVLVIGPSWAKSLKDRTLDPNDFVRIEVEQALAMGIQIIPVFAEGAVCPKPADIPESISQISLLNGLSVRSGTDFEKDIEKFIHEIESTIEKAGGSLVVLKNKLRKQKLMIAAGVVLAACIAFYYFRPQEDAIALDTLPEIEELQCETHEIAAIIAEFVNGDDGGLSNSIMTKLEMRLPDSLFNVRTCSFQDRKMDNYHQFIKREYFDEKCDTVGLYVNGYRNEKTGVFNIYTTNIGVQIYHPDYLNKNSIVLDNPKEIVFKTEKDAEFLADFIMTILSNAYVDNQEGLLLNFEFQEKYNLTNESEADLGSESVLGYVYLSRANFYAAEGNEQRANQFYDEAIKTGNEDVAELAKMNKIQAKEIAQVMDADPVLKKKRAENIQEHTKIESKFQKFLGEVEKVVKTIFDKIKNKKW